MYIYRILPSNISIRKNNLSKVQITSYILPETTFNVEDLSIPFYLEKCTYTQKIYITIKGSYESLVISLFHKDAQNLKQTK